MTDGRVLSLEQTGSRDATIGRNGTRVGGLNRAGSRGATVRQTSFTASAIMPPADLADPRNSHLIGDWI